MFGLLLLLAENNAFLELLLWLLLLAWLGLVGRGYLGNEEVWWTNASVHTPTLNVSRIGFETCSLPSIKRKTISCSGVSNPSHDFNIWLKKSWRTLWR